MATWMVRPRGVRGYFIPINELVMYSLLASKINVYFSSTITTVRGIKGHTIAGLNNNWGHADIRSSRDTTWSHLNPLALLHMVKYPWLVYSLSDSVDEGATASRAFMAYWVFQYTWSDQSIKRGSHFKSLSVMMSWATYIIVNQRGHMSGPLPWKYIILSSRFVNYYNKTYKAGHQLSGRREKRGQRLRQVKTSLLLIFGIVDSKGCQRISVFGAFQVDQNLYDPFEIKISQRLCVGKNVWHSHAAWPSNTSSRYHVVRDLGTENGIDAFVSCGVIVEDFELGELWFGDPILLTRGVWYFRRTTT